MSECHSSCTSALRYMIPACNNVYNTLINSQNKVILQIYSKIYKEIQKCK